MAVSGSITGVGCGTLWDERVIVEVGGEGRMMEPGCVGPRLMGEASGWLKMIVVCGEGRKQGVAGPPRTLTTPFGRICNGKPYMLQLTA